MLNLETKTKSQELVKAYLEKNATEALIEKINNGVQIIKDGKKLISKKTLDGFMKYAATEAKKLAEKDGGFACVEDSVVYGWAIHYFEEDSIEGKLYNDDGTEYVPPKPKTTKPTSTAPTPPVQKPKPQLSLFDMVDQSNDTSDKETENAGFKSEEIQDINSTEQPPSTTEAKPETVNEYYRYYLNIQERYPDSIIAYRLGDFFEVFGENAKLLADELNLTLTGRDVGLKERIPMIGVPYHALDLYVSKIISKGHKITVAEPQGEIKTFEPSHCIEQNQPCDIAQQTDDMACEREIAKAFDKDALLILSDLLGNIFTME